MRSCVYSPQPEQGRRIWCKQYLARRSLLRPYPQGKLNSHTAESTLYCGRLKVLYFFFLFSFKIKGREECCVATFYICLFFQNGEPCAWKGYLDSGFRRCSKSTKNINQLVPDVNLNISESCFMLRIIENVEYSWLCFTLLII